MQRTWKPIAGGILAIIAGSLNVLMMLAFMLFMAVPGDQWGFFPMLLNIGLAAVLLIVLGVVALAGGICALRRRAWGFALAGSICAILSVGMILGVAATVLVALSRGEFGRAPSAE